MNVLSVSMYVYMVVVYRGQKMASEPRYWMVASPHVGAINQT